LLLQSTLQYFAVIKRSYVNAHSGDPPPWPLDSMPKEIKAIYGDPANPAVPRWTYVDPGAIVSKAIWGRPESINTAAYSYPNSLIMPGSAGTNWWKAVF